jgi:hypothetical protein
VYEGTGLHLKPNNKSLRLADNNTPLIKFLWSFDILKIVLRTGGIFLYENGFFEMSKGITHYERRFVVPLLEF